MTSHSLPRALLAPVLVAALALPAAAHPVSVPSEEVHALTGARVLVAPGRELAEATILIRDGIIDAVGTDVRIPEGARVWDVAGHVIHAGFIDAHVDLARFNGDTKPDPKAEAKPKDAGVPAAPAPSRAGWGHPLVHPEIRVADALRPDADALATLRGQGFTVACVVPGSGILRGRDCVVALDGGPPGRSLLKADGDVHAAFETSGDDDDDSVAAPTSVMGATAILRQALLDADWHRRAAGARRPRRVAEDASLGALAAVLPQGRRAGAARLAFDCADVLETLRAGEVAREASAGLRVRAAGDEYRRLAEVAALGAPLVVPVTFPAPPVIVDEVEWLEVSDAHLQHWRLAPDNPRWLHEAGVAVSLTTDGLGQPEDFTRRVRTAIERGLRPQDALAMLTTRPAALLGLSDRLGTIERGRLAHLVVATGEPFAKGTEIREAWIDGRRFVVSRAPQGPLGTWAVRVSRAGIGFPATLKLEIKDGSLSWEKDSGGPETGSPAKITEVRVEGVEARFLLDGTAWGTEEPLVMTARSEGATLSADARGAALSLQGTRTSSPEPPDEDAAPEAPLVPPRPAGGPLTVADAVLFRNATIWTASDAGIVQGDVLVRGGLIAAVGKDLAAPAGALLVDMTGRHLTPGLIDAHAHVAIVGGVNEASASCTAEVRIGDVVNSESIDLYRLLAGGMTSANLLHGSANCMGGQSQVIRLKWGEDPAGLRFREAWPMIKFALGENVKQSNWGEKHVTRFPQTRMGVEQFMREKFQEARDWDEHWRARKGPGEAPARRDLQLEALAEILRGERKVHCHSYRQDEILGLIAVAEEFGFRVGTFQHVLEGYKVADEIAAHGAGASAFTDWWAFKFEVYDAIPHGPALMWERGVLTSVNSDSTELGRRMQLEAAKVAKWGNVPEHEALKFVTLNPARQLGIDALVGSIEPGKQADLATWSGPPLSTSSRCESTWIQGRKYFGREEDLAGRAEAQLRRADLVDRARRAARSGEASGEAWDPAYLASHAGCSESGGAHDHAGTHGGTP